MKLKITPQIAKVSGIHRHTGTGETKVVGTGETLPFREKEGFWEPLAMDQVADADKIVVLIREEGAIYRMRMGLLPVRGLRLNIRPDEGPLVANVYMITFIDESYPFEGGSTFALDVAPVAPFADDMLIHEAVLL